MAVPSCGGVPKAPAPPNSSGVLELAAFLRRSEPARSTRLSLHRVTTPDESTRERIFTWIVKIACPRVDERLS